MKRTGVRPQTRTRVRWGRVTALLVAFLLPLGAHAVAGAQSGDRAASSRSYVVRPGDTLWSIAVGLAGPNEDPRPYVDGLEDENHLSGPIVPGERLRVP